MNASDTQYNSLCLDKHSIEGQNNSINLISKKSIDTLNDSRNVVKNMIDGINNSINAGDNSKKLWLAQMIDSRNVVKLLINAPNNGATTMLPQI